MSSLPLRSTTMRALQITSLLGLAISATQALTITSNATGWDGPLFYSYWRNGGGATMTTNTTGNFSVGWSMGSNSNLVCGRGWRTGWSGHTINYNAGQFSTGTNAFISAYGWTTNPLVEYYVVETWGDWRPPNGTGAGTGTGTVGANGGTYDLYRKTVTGDSIQGWKTFTQVWSVRQSKRGMGTNNAISLQTHVNAWSGKGWNLGSHDYQIVALEAFGGNGSANITVW